MAKKMKKEQIWAFYAVLIVVLAVIGFFVAKKQNQKLVFALGGALIGLVVSLILWFAWGKKNSY